MSVGKLNMIKRNKKVFCKIVGNCTVLPAFVFVIKIRTVYAEAAPIKIDWTVLFGGIKF